MWFLRLSRCWFPTIWFARFVILLYRMKAYCAMHTVHSILYAAYIFIRNFRLYMKLSAAKEILDSFLYICDSLNKFKCWSIFLDKRIRWSKKVEVTITKVRSCDWPQVMNTPTQLFHHIWVNRWYHKVGWESFDIFFVYQWFTDSVKLFYDYCSRLPFVQCLKYIFGRKSSKLKRLKWIILTVFCIDE